MASTKYPEVTLDDLLDKCKQDSIEQMRQAHALAVSIYDRQLTMADVPQIKHARRVAGTVLDLGLSMDAVLAGLFCHVDELRECKRVEAVFGKEITTLIKGLRRLDIYTSEVKYETQTKDGKIKDNKHIGRTLEAIRRAVLGVIDGDVRVVLIRLAMALHTLRAAADLDNDRRQLIARDVQNIFAPLANRLGIWNLKWELEDLSFRFTNPKKYKEIAKALAERRVDRDARIAAARERLKTELSGQGIDAEITGRPKHIYSIYRKMERKRIGFDGIMDAHAVRVIIDQDIPEQDGLTDEQRKYLKYSQCYRALGIVHSIYEPIPSEFDDYIQHPKSNGYRSLHTAVRDESAKVVEIQIRTRRMHQEAEQGLAAHWAYKEGSKPTVDVLRQVEALRDVLDKIGDSNQATDKLDPRHDEVQSAPERVYVFTPNGDVIDLPSGSTPIDFAYYLHTNVGHRTRGAKVSGKMVPLTYQLQSGDRVEIITIGKKDDEYTIGRPNRDWMNPSSGYTGTTKARSRIRGWFRKYEREQNIEIGEAQLSRALRDRKVNGRVTVDQLAAHFGDSAEDFLVKYGFGDYRHAQIDGAIALILRELKMESAEIPEEAPERPLMRQTRSKSTKGLTVMGATGMYTNMARCCNPIPPEPILGYVTRGRGVTIHRATCTHIKARQITEAGRVVDADWGTEPNGLFQVDFHLKSYHGRGLLEKIAQTLQGQNINLVKTKSTRLKYHTNVYLLTEVQDLKQADWITKKLRTMPTVFEVQGR